MSPLEPIVCRESPRKILEEDFESLRGKLPIYGGWGYTKADACIIDKNDPIVIHEIPFDGVEIEHLFVEKRIYEEMIIFRSDDEKFSGITWKLLKQELISEAERVYDKLSFSVTAFPDKDWEKLRIEWEGPAGHRSPTFDQAAHEQKRRQCMINITREFWFEITSFYGG
ncbi:hypothetical protein [Rhodanobacter soli]